MPFKILTVGHACVDFVHGVTDHLTPNKKLDSVFSNIQLGGSAVNVASALKALGADVTVCTTLGSKSDITTTIFKQLLDAKGIDIVCNHIDSVATANSLVTVLPNGDRSITCYQSAEIVEDDSVDVDVSQYDIVLGDNYRPPLVSKLFDIAQSLSIPTMLDVDKTVAPTDSLPYATHVWFSHEAWQSFDMARIQQLCTIGVTNGENPVMWLEPCSSVFQSFTPRSTNVKNSLGAGDVFRASLALQLLMKKPLATAIECACDSAGEHISGKRLTKII
jgi:sugar/nucleoside kinase (ribokinase family)